MVTWIKRLLPAVPVIIEVAREARRMREPARDGTGIAHPEAVQATLERATQALEEVSDELRRVQALQAALERRLDVLGIVVWSVAGVLALVVIGLVVRLAA